MLISLCLSACGAEPASPRDSGDGADTGGDTTPAVTPGVAGGPCYPNNSCNDGLACTDGICADPGAAAGVVGGPCYPNDTCNAGLVCLGAVCAVASVDDTGVDTGSDTGVDTGSDTGSDTGGSGDTGPAPDTDTPPVEETIGPAGGVIEFGDIRLTVPGGALTADTAITISYAEDQAPAGYERYTAVYRFEPAGTTFAIPATVSARFDGDAGRATLFWTPEGATGFERRGGRVGGDGRLEEQITHFSEGFVGDGVRYTDSSDRSCVVTRLLEGRNATSAGINGGLALFFTVDDCEGRPVTGLTNADFRLLEDGRPLSSEAEATVLPADGRGIFVSLVLDFSSSTEPVLPDLLDGAAAFLTALEEARLPAQVQIMAFGGDATAYVAQQYTLDVASARAALTGLSAWRPTDIGATNLHGAVAQALSASATAQSAFRARNLGGAFSSGYVVVFTDGGDTAERVTLEQVQSAVSGSPDEVFMVGLRGADYDEAALTAVAPARNVLAAPSAAEIVREFAALANRIAGQALRTYLLGYCSPKRAGSHTVSVEVAGSENRSTASFDFGADGFTGSCRAAAFATVCEGNECGGLGCGACDDRTTGCVTAGSSFVCEDLCILLNECTGEPLVTDLGLPLVCAETLDRTSCGVECITTRSDVQNCGDCGVRCGAGGSCADGVCECPGADGRNCSGVCRDVAADMSNCGRCGRRCAVGGSCTDGVCECPGADGRDCSGVCRDVAADTSNCGDCGLQCAVGGSCAEGMCECPGADGRDCDGVCRDVAVDTTNCGGCGTRCAVGQNCAAGLCVCPADNHLEGGRCVSDTRACSPLPANTTAGTQTWDSSTGAYGTCTASACATAYHLEGGACLNDTQNCTPLPANATASTQTWNSSTGSYGTCTATACASGYVVNAGVCLLDNLGTACTGNAQCASGFCATGPAGTANDRCAPTGMNYIPAGTFTMGSPSGEIGQGFGETQHSVTLSRSFFMGQTEVTQGQWKELSGGRDPSCFQSTTGTACTSSNANDSGPVEDVDWYAAVAFANARSASEALTACYTLTGCRDAANGWKDGIHSNCTGATFSGLTCTGYRLPTESEWEYAARGGATTATYLGNLSGGVDDCSTAQANLDGIAWWCRNSGNRTNAVGGKTANSFGLSDMLGNVLEWTGDWSGPYPSTVTDPLGAVTGSARVIRGGSWANFAGYARAAYRSAGGPGAGSNDLGFRLARTAP